MRRGPIPLARRAAVLHSPSHAGRRLEEERAVSLHESAEFPRLSFPWSRLIQVATTIWTSSIWTLAHLDSCGRVRSSEPSTAPILKQSRDARVAPEGCRASRLSQSITLDLRAVEAPCVSEFRRFAEDQPVPVLPLFVAEGAQSREEPAVLRTGSSSSRSSSF